MTYAAIFLGPTTQRNDIISLLNQDLNQKLKIDNLSQASPDQIFAHFRALLNTTPLEAWLFLEFLRTLATLRPAPIFAHAQYEKIVRLAKEFYRANAPIYTASYLAVLACNRRLWDTDLCYLAHIRTPEASAHIPRIQQKAIGMLAAAPERHYFQSAMDFLSAVRWVTVWTESALNQAADGRFLFLRIQQPELSRLDDAWVTQYFSQLPAEALIIENHLREYHAWESLKSKWGISLRALWQGIKNNATLKTVSMQLIPIGNRLTWANPAENEATLTTMVEAITNHPSLSALKLSFFAMYATPLAPLFSAIRNSQITTLHIGFIQREADFALFLTELPTLALRELHINMALLRHFVIMHDMQNYGEMLTLLMTVLKSHRSLTTLRLYDDQFSFEHLQQHKALLNRIAENFIELLEENWLIAELELHFLKPEVINAPTLERIRSLLERNKTQDLRTFCLSKLRREITPSQSNDPQLMRLPAHVREDVFNPVVLFSQSPLAHTTSPSSARASPN